MILIDIGDLQDLFNPLHLKIGCFGPQATQQQCTALPLKGTLEAKTPAALAIELQQRAVDLLPLRVQQLPTPMPLTNFVVDVVVPPPIALTIGV
ncbi:hypothetical protein D3C77_293790 [compost metagenome]